MLKAYVVFVGDSPLDEGCVLVFAYNRNAARLMAYHKGPWSVDYIEIKARRIKWFDKYIKDDIPKLFETNDDLPEPFFTDEI